MRATIATPEGGDPGTALIEIFDAPPVEGHPIFTILSSQGYLSPDGWQESSTPLVPADWKEDNGCLRLDVGAAIVDQLDPLETYRLGLGDQVCALQVGDLLFSHMGGGQGMGSRPAPAEERQEAEAAPPPAGEEQPAEEQGPREVPPQAEPLPEAPQEPAAPLSMTPQAPPAAEETAATPVEMEPAAPRKSRLPLLLLLVLLLAGGVLAYRYLAPEGEETATAPLPELPKPDSPTPPAAPSAKATPDKTPAAPAASPRADASPAGAQALSEARTLLRRNAPPEETLAAGKALRTPDADARQSDAAFLLLEDAAQKGNAEAMFLVGRFYDPASELPRGSIPPDLSQAKNWYEAARDKGHAESAQALAALRAFAEQKARQGDEEARLLLQNWK